jgi:thiol-disulfide isomerase/thioredoxin
MKNIVPQSTRLVVGFVVTLFLGFAAPGPTPSAGAAKQEGPSSSAPRVMAPQAARAITANDIRVIDLEGLKKLLQRDPKDKRPLLLNFWATWCDPCREEFPDLVKLDTDYKSKPLNFIAISIDDIADLQGDVPKFLNQMKATMPVVLLDVKDPQPSINLVDPSWGGDMPATFLYDKDGKMVFKHFGKIKPDELRAAIDKEIKRSEP